VLFSAAQRRIARAVAEDLERATLAVNNGMAILRDEKARAQFERTRARRAEAEAPTSQSVAEYKATMARLAARFPASVRTVN